MTARLMSVPLAVAVIAVACVPMAAQRVRGTAPVEGTRLGDMGRDTVLYTKAQADIVFAAQSGAVPTNMSQLVDDVGYAKTNDIPVRVSQLDNDAGYVTAEQVAVIVAEAVRADNFSRIWSKENWRHGRQPLANGHLRTKTKQRSNR